MGVVIGVRNGHEIVKRRSDGIEMSGSDGGREVRGGRGVGVSGE